jgi:hypothetical protein
MEILQLLYSCHCCLATFSQLTWLQTLWLGPLVSSFLKPGDEQHRNTFVVIIYQPLQNNDPPLFDPLLRPLVIVSHGPCLRLLVLSSLKAISSFLMGHARDISDLYWEWYFSIVLRLILLAVSMASKRPSSLVEHHSAVLFILHRTPCLQRSCLLKCELP